MKTVGALLIFIGFAVAIYAFSMDTSVAGENGLERINNLGLMNDKQNILFAAGVLCVMGAIFYAAAYVAVSVRNTERPVAAKPPIEKVEQTSGNG